MTGRTIALAERLHRRLLEATLPAPCATGRIERGLVPARETLERRGLAE